MKTKLLSTPRPSQISKDCRPEQTQLEFTLNSARLAVRTPDQVNVADTHTKLQVMVTFSAELAQRRGQGRLHSIRNFRVTGHFVRSTTSAIFAPTSAILQL